MIIKISKTDEIEKKLREEGKIRTLDKKEHIAAMVVMNEKMREVHRDFLKKSAASYKSAKKVIFC